MTQTAVLMMAHGAPDSLDDVEPYLSNVRGGRETPPELVEEVRARYALIGGRSPLLAITNAQAQALERRLNAEAGKQRFRAYVGMRHWRPTIRQAVGQIAADGIRNVVALCMAPHYSRMSIGAYFKALREAQDALGADLEVARVEDWHDHPRFIGAVAEKVRVALERFSEEERHRIRIVFTAHSLPAAIVEQGDPYDEQVRRTAHLVADHLQLDHDTWQVCYQSAGSVNARWLGPPVEKVVVELADGGNDRILVAPIGFVADHAEILYDIDVECRRLAADRGARLERTESLNASPAFIEALADIVVQAGEVWPKQVQA